MPPPLHPISQLYSRLTQQCRLEKVYLFHLLLVPLFFQQFILLLLPTLVDLQFRLHPRSRLVCLILP